MLDILEKMSFRCSVSSVLNKDIKQHGKQFMFDLEEDTSWSSNQGTPQWINISLDEPQSLSAFSFQFQGGFAGKDAVLCITSRDGEQIYNEPFYPEDNNSNQKFQLKNAIFEKRASKLKFIFNTSTDTFGRIIIYKLRLFS